LSDLKNSENMSVKDGPISSDQISNQEKENVKQKYI